MTKLSERTYLALIDGLGHLYGARGLDDLRRAMVDVAVELIRADHASYNELDLLNGRAIAFLSDPDVNAEFERYEEVFVKHMYEHPILNHFLGEPNAETQRLSDFVSSRQLKSLGLYSEVYRPLETNYQMVAQLNVPDDVVVGLAINRSQRDFNDEELQVVRLLEPHLRQAYAACRRREQIKSLLDGRSTDDVVAHLRELGLTTRESEICLYMLQSKSNSEIGLLLGISPLTAKTHCERIFRKLGVAGRLHAALTIIAHIMEGD